MFMERWCLEYLDIWFYLQESPSGIVGSETWGNGATKIVILDKQV
jgi:hypothetical protein